MSTVRLWGGAFARGAQWRYLVLYVVGTLVPALVLLAPVHGFFTALFDHSTREAALVPSLDSAAFFEVIKQLVAPEGPDLHGQTHMMAVLALLLVGPALAGVAAAVADLSTAPRLRELLAAAGAYYPRMLRMVFVSLLPLGVAAALAAVVLKVAHRSEAHAVLETAATRTSVLAWIGVVLLVWLATSTVETGRAVLVAEPERKSAFLAWWRGVRFLVRRIPRVLGLCAATTVAALAVAAVLTAIRLRLSVSGPVTIALEFLVAQGAVAAVAWGRSSRLVGLVEMLRATE
jgi:hypothetical protein